MKIIKKIAMPDDSCEGCIYAGTPKCWVTQDADGDIEPCVELRYPKLDIYYIYVEEDEDEDSN